MNERKRFAVVVLYAVAMAWVESAVVYYMRTMIDRIEPYQPYPLPIVGGLGTAELVREAATLVMLLTTGILAGRTWRSRWGYTLIAFGVWDILYYVFLIPLTGWPKSLLDWDILFLLPLPWWGPVLAPVLIAALMITWGSIVAFGTDEQVLAAPGWKAWTSSGAGILLALYVFMTDSLRVADQGVDALRNLLPQQFNWPLFLAALLLMASPVIVMGREYLARRTLLMNAPAH